MSINVLAKKRPYILSPKVQNKNFSVISKYPFFINFLAQKIPYFLSPKVQNKKFSVISKYDIPFYINT